jgi:hypothetical protein
LWHSDLTQKIAAVGRRCQKIVELAKRLEDNLVQQCTLEYSRIPKSVQQMTMLEFFSMCMQKDVRLEALWPGLDLAAVKL